MRVEEDWALLVNDPDNGVVAPQFHTTMATTCSMDQHYAQVTWNYRVDYDEASYFAPGGLQLQAWDGESRLRRLSVGDAELSGAAEFITWTQGLETDGALMKFEIKDGYSSTWGEFGDEMKISSEATYSNLDNYCTDVSVRNSCITFGSNRVDALMIMQVRRYHQSGVIEVDLTPRVVFMQDE
jgi:hypothetical protein